MITSTLNDLLRVPFPDDAISILYDILNYPQEIHRHSGESTEVLITRKLVRKELDRQYDRWKNRGKK